MLRELLEGAALLTAVAGGVGFVALFGRDPRADEHDLADYREPDPLAEMKRRYLAAVRDGRPTVLPPDRARGALPAAAPVSMVTPPLCRRLLVEQAVPTLSDAAVRGIADEWLREIADEQQAKAGIRPASGGLCGSCDAGLPMACTCRDLTGAFPVARAA